MKPKKNPKADLRRKWVLFLQIGLILVLFLTLQAFQWKTIEKKLPYQDVTSRENLEEEIPPVTLLPENKPSKPLKIFTDVFKEIPNELEIGEEEIPPKEIDLEIIPEPADIIEPEKPLEPIEVPFEFIEEVPVFPGCETLEENKERKRCMSSKISQFVSREFNTGIGEKLGLTGTNLVVVMFVVNKNGQVENIRTRAPRPELENEARRVIGKLPQMQPGRQQGKAVPVSYTIPIRFKVQE